MKNFSQSTIEQAYLLHDHLEAIVTYGHKLKTMRLELDQAITHEARLENAAQATEFVETIKSLELVIISKILRARIWAERLQPIDSRFAPMVRLFVSGTNTLADSIQSAASPSFASFGHTAQHRDYLIARGILAKETFAFDQVTEFQVGKDFLLNGSTSLAELSTQCRTFADMLDTHFTLYEPVPAVIEFPEAKIRKELEEISDTPDAVATIEDIADARFLETNKHKLTLSERLEQLDE